MTHRDGRIICGWQYSILDKIKLDKWLWLNITKLQLSHAWWCELPLYSFTSDPLRSALRFDLPHFIPPRIVYMLSINNVDICRSELDNFSIDNSNAKLLIAHGCVEFSHPKHCNSSWWAQSSYHLYLLITFVINGGRSHALLENSLLLMHSLPLIISILAFIFTSFNVP